MATHPCLVCKTEAVSSRALPKSDATQYGLKEEDITPGARVCNLCRCKSVRSRFTQCPVLTCPNTKGNRIKRLRSMPCKWAELPQQVKQPVIMEFRKFFRFCIPSNLGVFPLKFWGSVHPPPGEWMLGCRWLEVTGHFPVFWIEKISHEICRSEKTFSFKYQ